MIFWLVLKFDISYRIMMSQRIFVFFSKNILRLHIHMVKYLSFHNYFFALRYVFRCDTPLVAITICVLDCEAIKT
jgi:hypothetical protein